MSARAAFPPDTPKRKRDARGDKGKANDDIADFHLTCKASGGNETRRETKDDVIADLAAMGCTTVEDPVCTDAAQVFEGFAASDAFISRSLKTQANTLTRTRMKDDPEVMRGMADLFPEVEEHLNLLPLPTLRSPPIPLNSCGHSEPHSQVRSSAYAFGSQGPRSVFPALPWMGSEGIGIWKGETSGDPYAPLIGGALWSRHIINERDTPVTNGLHNLLGSFTQSEVEWDGRWIHEGTETDGILVYNELTGAYKKISRATK